MTAVLDRIEAWLDRLHPTELGDLDDDLLAIEPKEGGHGEPVPADWRQRIPLVFPRAASKPFAERHVALWEWVNAIGPDSTPRPFCAFWPRGGGKSSTVEMAIADLGCRGKRRYVWYVRMTQTKADDSVQNIALRLESREVELHYPEHAKRNVSKYGTSRGWRRNRLWTRGGFVVDALGLDTAARGSKMEDQRPDLIVFDDIDDLHDGPAQTKKKIDIITKSILPAGANNVAVLFVQNLIIPNGVASQLADSRADFLSLRLVSGPFPAVEGLTYEWQVDPRTGIRRAAITAGRATWAGQDLATCQRNIEQWGLSAFLKEAQHKVQGKGEGVALRFDPARHLVDLTDDEALKLVQRGRAFAGIDFGAWRFGFTLWCMTPSGRVVELDEIFSQKEGLAVRARKIHALCVRNGIEDPSPKTCPIWGDAANPQDILELNLAFRAGWDDEDTGQHVTSKLRVVAVANENKARKNAVERINDAYDRGLLVHRRGIYAGQTWLLGMNAGSEGTPQTGSRLLWEIDNWAVMAPKEGEAQDDNPDDDTADGADLIASERYALMSHWRPVKTSADTDPPVPNDKGWAFDVARKEFREPRHMADLLSAPHGRRPALRGHRPKVR